MKLKNPGLRSPLIKKPITVTPKTGLLDAMEVMQKFRISRLVVIDKNYRPAGILTEKDILRFLFPLGAKPLGSITVDDCMSKNLVTVKKSDSVYKCAKVMKDNGISSVLVLGEGRSLEGLVTKTDLVFNFLTQDTPPLQVSKIMTSDVITVSPDDHLYLVESILINNKISRVPVTKNKKPVGIITFRDFIPARIPNRLGAFTDPQEVSTMWKSGIPNRFSVNQLDYVLTFRAEDIMTKNPVTMGPSEDVSVAALIMYRYDISGIPVVRQSRLAGIITKSDIISVLAVEA